MSRSRQIVTDAPELTARATISKKRGPWQGNQWLTTKEAVKMIGRSARTLRRLNKQGKLSSKLSSRSAGVTERLYLAEDLKRLAPSSSLANPQDQDYETAALTKVIAILKPLGLETRTRILRYLVQRFLDANRDLVPQ